MYQIEFVEHSEEPDIDKQLKNIINLLSNFVEFKKKNQNIKLIGYTWVKYIDQIKYIKKLQLIFFKNKNNIYFPDKLLGR